MNFTINTKHSNIFFRSTTSTTTTATEAIETQNEVIRSRSRSPNSDRGGRVKIRVRQKKRPFTTTAIPTTTFTKTLPQFAGESLALKMIHSNQKTSCVKQLWIKRFNFKTETVGLQSSVHSIFRFLVKVTKNEKISCPVCLFSV